MENSNVNKVSLPLIATRGFIMFPYNSASLDIVRSDSEHAVESARANHDGYIILSSLIDSKSDDVSFDNICNRWFYFYSYRRKVFYSVFEKIAFWSNHS